MRKFLASVAVIFALCAPVQAQEECKVTWESQYSQLSENGWRSIEMTGDDLDNFVANFNNYEPKSDYHPDHVWVLSDPNYQPGFVNVAFVKDGCVIVHAQDMPIDTFIEFLTPPGDPA